LRWRTVPREALIWRELDGELAVRNAESGSTHLLGALAGEILRALIEAQSGLTLADLVARLSDDTAPEAEWQAAIQEVLADFERLGLAERMD
jgi:PqqD family protein of HPr-rel-A system